MANRNFANGGKVYTMHVSPVIVNTNITIGATGAVTSSTAQSMVPSVTRVSTGIYKINFSEAYSGCIFAQADAQSPVSGLSGISSVEIQNAPTASVSNAAAPSITIKTLSAAGALADPASGSVISFMAMLSNSSVKIP